MLLLFTKALSAEKTSGGNTGLWEEKHLHLTLSPKSAQPSQTVQADSHLPPGAQLSFETIRPPGVSSACNRSINSPSVEMRVSEDRLTFLVLFQENMNTVLGLLASEMGYSAAHFRQLL